jgi:glycosyltransferase involved in cell wall biosynthesis
MSLASTVSLIIKTFERQSCIERLLQSIRTQGFGDHPILVADDSREPYRDAVLDEFGDIVDDYIVLPFNVGISRGRNELLKRVESDFFVLHDGDFVYGDMTRLGRAYRLLQEYDLDLLGGYVVEEEKEYHFDLLPDTVSDTLRLYEREWQPSAWVADLEETDDGGVAVRPRDPSDGDNETAPIRCDLTLNFFLARTDAIRNKVGGWDPALKSTGEHWEFFYRCKESGLDVAFSDAFGIYHRPDDNARYERYRYDDEEEMLQRSLRRHDFRYLDRGDAIFQCSEPADP